MSELLEKKASCLCGAVKFVCKSVMKNVSACHCTGCRKWGGGPYFAVKCGTDVSIEGEEDITIYDSSAWAQRGFCKTCGSHLFYRFKENGEYRLSLGLFNDEQDLFLETQYFVDMKSCVYELSNETNEMTSEEIFAIFKSAPNASMEKAKSTVDAVNKISIDRYNSVK